MERMINILRNFYEYTWNNFNVCRLMWDFSLMLTPDQTLVLWVNAFSNS